MCRVTWNFFPGGISDTEQKSILQKSRFYTRVDLQILKYGGLLLHD